MIENYIANKMGHMPMARDTHKKNWGKPIKEAIAQRIPGIDVEKFMELHRSLLSGFVEAGKLDVISDNNIKILEALKNNGKKLAILTSRAFHEVEHLLDENHRMNRLIEKFYHSGNSKFLKPDPRVFDEILGDFGVAPQEAVYVGDSLSDGISAKGANLYFIASLESGLRSKKDFDSIKVDFFANKFEEITGFID